MGLKKIDNFITDESVGTYRTLLRFWLYSLPAFLFVVFLLKYFSELHTFHYYALILFICVSFILVLVIHSLLHQKNSTHLFLFIYISGIAYPLISPAIVFFITTFYAPDFSLAIMNHTIPSLFLIMTMATGFSFSFRVSLFSGFFSTFLFSICFFYLRMTHPQAVIDRLQMVGWSYYIEITVYIFLSGLLSGLLANQARRMLGKIYDTVKEREFVTQVLGEYVSEEVRDKILVEGGLHNQGEEKEVTVLFADLRDFTSLSEDYNPRDIVFLLNEYFDSMVDVIQKNGGVIDKFIGDAVMAYFGAPVSMANPQQKAFQASLQMADKLKTLNQKLLKNDLPSLRQGIGLHHGSVVIGNIGSKKRKNYTIIGDTVNMASRLESLTKELNNSLVVSESVYANLKGKQKNRFQHLPNVSIKGKKETISVFSWE